MNFPEGPLARILLAVPSRAYALAVHLRNRSFGRPGTVRRAAVPVISVGNIIVGGTGKTPMTAWLCRLLQDRGLRPAVVSRGYGGSAGRGPVVVSDGGGPVVGPETAGDEPLLLAGSLPGVPVVVGSDRITGAGRAAELGAEIVILDDGFQHRALARDLDVVLLDSARPFGNGRMLPAGPLREPPESLDRAGAIVLTRHTPSDRRSVAEDAVREHNTRAPLLTASISPAGFVNLGRERVQSPERAYGFCGIGNPASFRDTLEAEGVELAGFRAFRDHHRYRTAEIERLDREARRRGAVLVTTEKDLVRLRRSGARDASPTVLALRIEMTVHDEEVLAGLVMTAVGRAGS